MAARAKDEWGMGLDLPSPLTYLLRNRGLSCVLAPKLLETGDSVERRRQVRGIAGPDTQVGGWYGEGTAVRTSGNQRKFEPYIHTETQE